MCKQQKNGGCVYPAVYKASLISMPQVEKNK